jgi:hypothetical protein
LGHYLHIFTPSDRIPTVSSLRNTLAKSKLDGTLEVATGNDADWAQIEILHANGAMIAVIERDATGSGELMTQVSL